MTGSRRSPAINAPAALAPTTGALAVTSTPLSRDIVAAWAIAPNRSDVRVTPVGEGGLITSRGRGPPGQTLLRGTS